MRVVGLRWLGIRSPDYEPMVRLLRDTMRLRVELEEAATTELSLPDGARLQVFGPGHRYFELFGELASGPVALLEVDDVRAARAELAAAGVELLGGIERDSGWEWFDFRAPDGNLYELGSRRPPG